MNTSSVRSFVAVVRSLFTAPSTRRFGALNRRVNWCCVEALEPVCLLSGVTVVADPSPVGYPTSFSATVDSAVVEVGSASSTTTLDAVFSAFGRFAGTQVIDGILYVPGTSSDGDPIEATQNLNTGAVETLVFQDFGGTAGTSVVGVFQQDDGTILFGGFSNPGSKQAYTYWGLDGIPHEMGDGGVGTSYSFNVSPTGRMVGTTGNTASYVDIGVEGSHNQLPEKLGFSSSAGAVSDDNQFIVGAAFDELSNFEGRVWKLQNGAYVLYEDTFSSPSGDPILGFSEIEKFGTEWLILGGYFDGDGIIQSGVWNVDGTFIMSTGPGSSSGMLKIGDSLILPMTYGSEEDHILIVNPSFQTRSYSVSDLGFTAGSTLEFGSLFVTPSGELGVIGTNPETGVVTVKTFPITQPTFSYEVDVTGDGVPELSGTTQGPLVGSWVFDSAGNKKIDVKMTSRSGDITTGSSTVVVNKKISFLLPRYTMDTTPTFSWKQIPGMANTQVWLNNGTTGVGAVVNVTVPHGDGTYTFEELNMGEQRVWIRHQSTSGTWGPWSYQVNVGIQTRADSPQVTFGDDPAFSWPVVPGATAYVVWVNDASGKRVIYEPQVQGNSCPFTLPEGVYKVWVRAKSAGQGPVGIPILGTWSVPKTFGVPPKIIGVDVSGPKAIVSWKPFSGATKYDIWIGTVSPWVLVERDENISASAVSFTSSVGPGEYRVWIRALNTNGIWSPWSAPVDFKVA